MKKRMSNNTLLIISFVLFIVMIMINVASVKGMINGSSQKDVSAMFPTIITPAGYAFIIWSVIYLLVLASLIILFFNSRDEHCSAIIRNTSFLFWVSCVFNIAWTFAFSYRLIWLSAIFIVCILLPVVMMMQKLKKIERPKKTVFDIALGIYGGWLFVASIVNIAAFFVSINFRLLENNSVLYAVIIGIAVVAGLLLNKTFRNPFFHLAILWAFIAIMVAINFTASHMMLFVTLAAGAFVLLIMAGREFKQFLSFIN